MKNQSRTNSNIFIITTAVLISVLMCFCMCACGDNANTEETVEITTPTEMTSAPADNHDISAGINNDENGSENADDSGSDADKNGSQYKKIYNDCNTQMKADTAKYVSELKEKSSSLSKSKLYDETQARIDELKKVYDDGKDKMVKAMLASTEDDAKEYNKYFTKMTESYTEYTREITSAYTDAF